MQAKLAHPLTLTHFMERPIPHTGLLEISLILLLDSLLYPLQDLFLMALSTMYRNGLNRTKPIFGDPWACHQLINRDR